MTATFDISLASKRDHIRLALGDIDASSPLLVDETIDAKLSAFSYLEALAQLAEALVAQFGQRPDEYSESGGLSIKWGERIAAWRKLAEDARSGKIEAPTTAKTQRYGAAVKQLNLQSQTGGTPRTIANIPTLMEGFRSD